MWCYFNPSPITVNLAIFWKFRWGRWRRPRAPFSSCRRGLQTESSLEEWDCRFPASREPEPTWFLHYWWGRAYPLV
ncbi:hypothetical protein CapIbe_016917 [Capra ibex]